MLSDERILAHIGQGSIIIEPFDKRHLGPNSYDCRLGEWYFSPNSKIVEFYLNNQQELADYWGDPLQASDMIAIAPGTMILAHTQEVIGSLDGVVAKMYSRSTVARSGLSVCRCAGVGDVGYIGRWTMEITNHTHATIYVPVGFRTCQFTFEYAGRTLNEYKGKYGTGQREWTPMDMLPKPGQDWDHGNYGRK